MDAFLAQHWLDITTTVLGLLYILLELKASVWMWVVGIVMQLLGIVLYYQKGLYADCGMEFYYLAMSGYGLTRWMRATRLSLQKGVESSGAEIKSIFHAPHNLLPALGGVGVGLLLWALIYWLLVTFTNSTVPLADSFTTALSIIGIWALAHKYLEQWFIWIAVDVVTSILYFYKDIPFKASLYALYVVIAIFGYVNWRRKMRTQNQSA
ncbi:MAG: nicotinamide mononucleotide transporter [Bacteroidaceae bacterium]|nr:nicotinamide mononucleotide transporter [Bacteroidaceae bacterium]